MSKDIIRKDILKEIFNVSVGKAASTLSEIINKKILLDVPNIEILSLKNDKVKINKYMPKVLEGTLMISSINFEEKIAGKANLIFPADKMRTFINFCLNSEENTDHSKMEFTDIDFDIIKEMGNIILNSIIGEFGNFLNIEFDYSLPQVKVYNKIDFQRDIESKEYLHMLMLYVTFRVEDTEIDGAIIIDLNFKSLEVLLEKIDEMEEELDG